MRYLAILDGNEHEIEIEELGRRLVLDHLRQRIVSKPTCAGSARCRFSVLVDNRSFDFDVGARRRRNVVASRTRLDRLTVADASRRTSRAAGQRREVTGRVEIKIRDAGTRRQPADRGRRRSKSRPGNRRGRGDENGNEVKAPKPARSWKLKLPPGRARRKRPADAGDRSSRAAIEQESDKLRCLMTEQQSQTPARDWRERNFNPPLRRA